MHAMTMEKTIKDLRSILNSAGPLSEQNLKKEYREFFGTEIPFHQLGFLTLIDFLRSTNQFNRTKTIDGFQLSAKVNQKSAHVVELRLHQNVSAAEKKRRKRAIQNNGRNLVRPQIKSVAKLPPKSANSTAKSAIRRRPILTQNTRPSSNFNRIPTRSAPQPASNKLQMAAKPKVVQKTEPKVNLHSRFVAKQPLHEEISTECKEISTQTMEIEIPMPRIQIHSKTTKTPIMDDVSETASNTSKISETSKVESNRSLHARLTPKQRFGVNTDSETVSNETIYKSSKTPSIDKQSATFNIHSRLTPKQVSADSISGIAAVDNQYNSLASVRLKLKMFVELQRQQKLNSEQMNTQRPMDVNGNVSDDTKPREFEQNSSEQHNRLTPKQISTNNSDDSSSSGRTKFMQILRNQQNNKNDGSQKSSETNAKVSLSSRLAPKQHLMEIDQLTQKVNLLKMCSPNLKKNHFLAVQ